MQTEQNAEAGPGLQLTGKFFPTLRPSALPAPQTYLFSLISDIISSLSFPCGPIYVPEFPYAVPYFDLLVCAAVARGGEKRAENGVKRLDLRENRWRLAELVGRANTPQLHQGPDFF